MVPSLTEMRRAVSRRLRAISRPAARTALSTSGGAVFGGFRAALPRCRHGLAGSRLPVGKWHRRSVEHRGLLPHQADPAGDRVVYQNMLAFQASVMAVDPAGNVYLAGNDFVQKLSADAPTLENTTRIGRKATMPGLAADPGGRAYVTGWSSGQRFPNHARRLAANACQPGRSEEHTSEL